MKGQQQVADDSLISVIIPVYNCERYIAQAIESVLAQEYKNIEIIVVNDGSTDNTEKVVCSYANVKYLSQTRNGVSMARNTGIQNSSGEFVAFLDADDLWTKDKLKIQNSLFSDDPDLDMVFGQVEQFFSPELEESLKGRIDLTAARMPGYLPGAMLIKRNSFFKSWIL